MSGINAINGSVNRSNSLYGNNKPSFGALRVEVSANDVLKAQGKLLNKNSNEKANFFISIAEIGQRQLKNLVNINLRKAEKFPDRYEAVVVSPKVEGKMMESKTFLQSDKNADLDFLNKAEAYANKLKEMLNK